MLRDWRFWLGIVSPTAGTVLAVTNSKAAGAFISQVICAGRQVLCWAWMYFLTMVDFFIEKLEGEGFEKDVFANFIPLYSLLDYWFPLAPVIGLLTVVQLIVTIVIGVRLVKKWIPTLSG